MLTRVANFHTHMRPSKGHVDGREETAEQWFISRRWPNGIACPRCGSLSVTENAKYQQRFWCKDCRRRFSVKTGTVLQSSNLSDPQWALAYFLYSTNLKGVSSMKLHRDLGITQKAAWHVGHRIREAWAEMSDTFSGPVEVDETYIGGKEKNKHQSKKLNAGRGTVGKVAVVGMKDRETGRITSEVVESTDGPTLKGFVEDRTESDTVVYTDEAAASRTCQDLTRRSSTAFRSTFEIRRTQMVWSLTGRL